MRINAVSLVDLSNNYTDSAKKRQASHLLHNARGEKKDFSDYLCSEVRNGGGGGNSNDSNILVREREVRSALMIVQLISWL